MPDGAWYDRTKIDPAKGGRWFCSEAEARAAGKDYLSQTEEAVRTVRQARPDMTASDALVAVNLVRRA